MDLPLRVRKSGKVCSATLEVSRSTVPVQVRDGLLRVRLGINHGIRALPVAMGPNA